ncbi:MAG: hypothetical protein QW074_03380 [Candidatus Caldarchaeum sp.]
MARLGRFMVGPFTSWMHRVTYVDFVVKGRRMRERLASYGVQPVLGLPLYELERAYVDRDGALWLLISSKEYDLVKHFRGKPSIWRRLPCLWSMRCRSCGTYLETGLQGSSPCQECGGKGRPIVFWRDAYSHEVFVGPCRVGVGGLECGGRTYYVGEVVSLSRDMLGNLYARVLSFLPGESVDARMVEVTELPELGWSKPEVVAD